MILGEYEVVSEVGRGGIGVVYKARDRAGRLVAIKVLQRLDDARRQRFDRERRLLESLNEADGFVPLIGAGMSPHGPFLVMPFVPGGTLRDRLEKGTLGIEETAELGAALALTLGRAHERGIVHRDMKPDNIIFDATGRPLILDLGLAKHFHKDSSSQSVSLSKTGDSMGTIAYMAPEQANNSKSVGPSADVFALGAILYECLAGGPAFHGDTTIEVFAKIQLGTFDPIRSKRHDTPRWLASVIERSLERDPVKRLQDGAALARAIAARDAGTKPRGVALLAGVALLVVAACVAALALRPKPGPAPPPTVVVAPPPPPPPVRKREPAKPIHESRYLRSIAVWGSHAGRHGSMVQSVKFSPDGRLLASCDIDGNVRVWDATDLEEVRAFANVGGSTPGNRNAVRQVAFMPDSKRVVAACNDARLRVLEVESGKTAFTLEGHDDEIFALAVSADGRRALTGAKDKRVGLWDLEAGRLVRWFEGHTGILYSVAFSPDGTRALSGAADKTARVWDVETGRELHALGVHPDELQAVAWSPDGKLAATAAKDGLVRLFDPATGDLVRAFERHENWATSVAFSPDGRRLVSGSFDDTMKVLVVATGATERTIAESTNWIIQASWSPDGKRIASGGNDGTVRVWEASSGIEAIPTKGHRGRATAVALSRDGKVALSSGSDRTVRVWDATKGTERVTLPGHGAQIMSVALSPDGRRALSGGGRNAAQSSGELFLWDLETGRGQALEAHQAPVLAVAFAPSGKTAVSGSWAAARGVGEARVWTLGDPVTSEPVPGADSGAISLTFEAEGHVFAGTAVGTQLWDLESRVVQSLSKGKRVVTAIAHEGALVLAGDFDGGIVGFDSANPGRTVDITGNGKPVLALAITPDGKRAISSADDGTVSLWSLDEARELDRVDLAARGDAVHGLAIYPDGRSFIVATRRGPVLRFELLR